LEKIGKIQEPERKSIHVRFLKRGDADEIYDMIEAIHLHAFFALLQRLQELNTGGVVSGLFSDAASVLACSLSYDPKIVAVG
jgi:hypothetical protein